MKNGMLKKGISVLATMGIVTSMAIPGSLIAGATDYTGFLSAGGSISGASNGTTLTKSIAAVGSTSKQFDITLGVSGASGQITTAPTDIVLVLDTSSSMSGTDIANEKTAANDFLLTALQGSNVTAAVVDFNTSASVYKKNTHTSGSNNAAFVAPTVPAAGLTLPDATGASYFSNSISDLGYKTGAGGTGSTIAHGALNILPTGGRTFTQQALMLAQKLLETRDSGHRKMVVLMSDGVPTYSYRVTGTSALSSSVSLGGQSYSFYGTTFQYANIGSGPSTIQARVGNGLNFNLSSYAVGGDTSKTVYDNGLAAISQAKLMYDNDSITTYTVGYGLDSVTGGTTQQATDTLTQCATLGHGSAYTASPTAADLTAALQHVAQSTLYSDVTVADTIDTNTFDFVGFVENGSVTNSPTMGDSISVGNVSWLLPSYQGTPTSITYRVELKDTAAAPATTGTHTVAGTGTTTINSTAIATGTQPYVTVGTGSLTAVNYLVNSAGTPVNTDGTPTTGAALTAKEQAAHIGASQSISPLDLGSAYSVPGVAGYTAPGVDYTLHGSALSTTLTLDNSAPTLYIPYTRVAGTVTVHYVDAGGNAISGVSSETLPAGKIGDAISVPVNDLNHNNRTSLSAGGTTYSYSGQYKIGSTGTLVTSGTIAGTWKSGTQDIYLYYTQDAGTVSIHHYRVNSSNQPVDANGNTGDTHGTYTSSSAAVQLPGDTVHQETVAVGSSFGPSSANYATDIPDSIIQGTTAYALVAQAGGYTAAVTSKNQSVDLYVPYRQNTSVTFSFVDENETGSNTIQADFSVTPHAVGDSFSYNIPQTIQYNGYTYTYDGTYTSPITGLQGSSAQSFTLNYKKNVTVTVNYHDVNDGSATFTPFTQSGHKGDNYTIPGVTGYTQVAHDGSPTVGSTYQMTNSSQTFDVYLKKDVTVTVNYHDVNDGSATFTPFTQNGYKGDNYTIPGVTGYMQVAHDGSPTVGSTYQMTNSSQTFDVYLKKGVSVTIHYHDSNDPDTILPDTVFSGYKNTDYTVPGVTGYHQDASKGGPTIGSTYQMTNSNQVLNVYLIRDVAVTIHYHDINDSGVSIPDATFAGVKGTNYTVPSVDGYVQVARDGSPTVGTSYKMTNNDQEFDVYLKKNVSVTVNYHDVDDPTATFDQFTQSGFSGDSYTIPGVTGYVQVVHEGSPLIGTAYQMTNASQTFDVYIQKGSYTYTVNYYTDDSPIVPFASYTGPATVLGGKITSVPDKTPTGYKLDTDQSSSLPLTITADSSNNVISIYYGIVPQAAATTIIVHYYLDGTTTSIRDDDTDVGLVGDPFTKTAPGISNYTVKGSGSVTIASLQAGSNEITFYYTKNAETVVIPDNTTPLDSNPKTGDSGTHVPVLPLLMSIVAFAGVVFGRKARKNSPSGRRDV